MSLHDPFACFGDDDDGDSSKDDTDDTDIGTISHSSISNSDRDRELAQRLVEQCNRAKTSELSGDDMITNSYEGDNFKSSYQDQLERVIHLPWPHRPPLYLGPMELDKSLIAEGGGRGYMASRDLLPGTCVLIEEPLVRGWSDQQLGKRLGLESVHHILQMDDAQTIVDCLQELHPRKQKVDEVFKVIDAEITQSTSVSYLDRVQIVEMISAMEKDENYNQCIQKILSLAEKKNIVNSDGSSLNERDISRLLLNFRYNGFDSGLYLHFSMFNHDEDPNCVKFRPADDSAKLQYSEARTTRFVKKGEALTLHYLENPREVSHATRRIILWDQHRFDIGGEDVFRSFLSLPTSAKTNTKRSIYESELVGGSFPQSSIAETTNIKNDFDQHSPNTINIEKSLDDLEEILMELQLALKSNLESTDMQSYFDRAASFELTMRELITASLETLRNSSHILLSRCRRLHLDVIEILITKCSFVLTSEQLIELMVQFLSSVQPLLKSQKERLGNDHPDVARTNLDFSMAIQAMLSRAPKRLLSLKLENMGTLEQCSKMESVCRSEKERIDRLYPKDVDVILKIVKGQ